jgi:SAM-dependent methyltransferase
VSLPLTKVCDAADWFDPEMLHVVREELREPPRFHRKQWEFALVFQALERLGLLGPACDGLALGGGRERLLYAVAPRVRRLLVTDLYAPDTTWKEARTDDPDSYVREGAPFAVDLRALQVRRMDMRELELPDRAFDFAYSCCAIEHIGTEADFAHHLREVHRVLRPGGAYVFTTEFHYGQETVADPQNFVFGVEALRALLASNPLLPEAECRSALAPHRANLPLPEDIGQLFAAGGLGGLLRELPHVQLLRGALPHSSASVVLRKVEDAGRRAPMEFPGLGEAQEFLAEAVGDYRRWLEGTTLPLEPFGYLGGRSPYLNEGAAPAAGTAAPPLFHTRYAWLGGGRRRFELRVHPSAQHSRLEVRVHRQRTFGCGRVEAVATARIDLAEVPVQAHLTVDVDPDSSYAFLGEFVEGACRVRDLSTQVGAAGAA